MELTRARKIPDGTRYWRLGRGAPVVLIHGVGLDATMWQSQVEALARQHDVIVYDMLGHGGSPLPRENARLEDYAEQLAALLDHLELEKCAVVGFSMGGLVARAFALRHPQRLAAMVILSSVFDRDEDERAGVQQRLAQTREAGPSANIGAALQRWFSPDFHRAHPDRITRIHEIVSNNHPQGYYRSYALFGTEDRFGAERLGSIRVPVLVATGELDPGSTPRMAHDLAARLPNAEVHIFPGQRHMVPMEGDEAVNTVLRRFLAKAFAQAPSKEALR